MTSQGQQNDKKSDKQHPLITDERDDDVKSTQEEEIGNEMKDVITDRDESDDMPAMIANDYLDNSPITPDITRKPPRLIRKPKLRGKLFINNSKLGSTRSRRNIKSAHQISREQAKEQAKRASHKTGNRSEVNSPRKKAKVQCNVHGPVASTNSSEFNHDVDRTCSQESIPETDKEDTFYEHDEFLDSLEEISNDLDEQAMDTESLPGPSGLCSPQEKQENEDVTETVETISVSLVTTRMYLGEDLLSERKEHVFSSSLHNDPREMDWESFFEGVQEEIQAHARDEHRRQADAEFLKK
ncbi:unnamed protein product [Mytilus coruscus]|uniref:Uncharacterized protein n=1 Tax=Mytilus coruscus TaxID=42192 RepID=A0A6J8C6S9_MYTCO|nr:unnamed protein product [Mytilus coruscus]